MKFFMGKREKTYNRSGEEHVMTEYRPRLGRIIACCAALLIVLGAGLSSFTVVGAGHTGVVSTFGQGERVAGGLPLQGPLAEGDKDGQPHCEA